MTIGQRWGKHLFDLFVGMGMRAGRKLVKSIPQGCDHEVNHLARDIQQAQGLCLDLVWQAQRITERLGGEALAIAFPQTSVRTFLQYSRKAA